TEADGQEPAAALESDDAAVLRGVAGGSGERLEDRVPLHLVIVLADDGLPGDHGKVGENLTQRGRVGRERRREVVPGGRGPCGGERQARRVVEPAAVELADRLSRVPD